MRGFKLSKLPSSDAFFIKDPVQGFHNLPKQHHQMGTKNSDTRAYGDIAHSDHHSGSHLINVVMAFWGIPFQFQMFLFQESIYELAPVHTLLLLWGS